MSALRQKRSCGTTSNPDRYRYGIATFGHLSALDCTRVILLYWPGGLPRFKGGRASKNEILGPCSRSAGNRETRMYTLKSVMLTMTAIGTIAIVAQTATAQNSAAPNAAAREQASRPAPAQMPMD